MHDVIAYPLMAAFSCVLAAGPRWKRACVRQEAFAAALARASRYGARCLVCGYPLHQLDKRIMAPNNTLATNWTYYGPKMAHYPV